MDTNRLAPMAQSESKAVLFRRLGLEERDKGHRRLYNMMKDEAGEGWKRLTQSPDSLVSSLRDDPKLEPGRYTFAQIDETVMRNELARIYRDASPATKIIYDLAQDNVTGQNENWIIRWLLWHVFRYRDERNGSRNKKSSGLLQGDHDAAESSGGAEPSTFGMDSASNATNLLQHEQQSKYPSTMTLQHQPSGGLPSGCSTPATDSARVSLSTPEPSRTRYWDPVREVWREPERTNQDLAP